MSVSLVVQAKMALVFRLIDGLAEGAQKHCLDHICILSVDYLQ